MVIKRFSTEPPEDSDDSPKKVVHPDLVRRVHARLDAKAGADGWNFSEIASDPPLSTEEAEELALLKEGAKQDALSTAEIAKMMELQSHTMESGIKAAALRGVADVLRVVQDDVAKAKKASEN